MDPNSYDFKFLRLYSSAFSKVFMASGNPTLTLRQQTYGQVRKFQDLRWLMIGEEGFVNPACGHFFLPYSKACGNENEHYSQRINSRTGVHPDPDPPFSLFPYFIIILCPAKFYVLNRSYN